MSQKYPSSKPAILHGIPVICAALLVASLAGAENRVSGVAAEGQSLSITGISPELRTCKRGDSGSSHRNRFLQRGHSQYWGRRGSECRSSGG